MAKLTIEIDTEKKTMAFAKDGQEINVTEASAGCYTYKDCDGKVCKQMYASYGTRLQDGSMVSRYISFDSDSATLEELLDDSEAANMLTSGIAKLDKTIRAAKKMGKSMMKKKECDSKCKDKK